MTMGGDGEGGDSVSPAVRIGVNWLEKHPKRIALSTTFLNWMACAVSPSFLLCFPTLGQTPLGSHHCRSCTPCWISAPREWTFFLCSLAFLLPASC